MALVASMVSTSAMAAYVGADVGTQHLNGSAVDSAGVHVGANVNTNLALELGLSQTQTGNGAKDMTTSLDAVGILPVGGDTDLLGTVGVESQSVTATGANDTKIGPTLGLGAQYHVSDAISVRALVKYEDVNLPTINSDHDVKSTIGINVAF